MSLGTAVHQVLENLGKLPREARFAKDLLGEFVIEFEKFRGEKGGFRSKEEEEEFYARGREMIKGVMEDHAFFENLTIKEASYYKGNMIPNYYIDEKENLILCGSIDWIEFLPETNELRVIDLKTGKNDESDDSMQLPIYKLILENLQNKWKVKEGAYYYLDRHELVIKAIDDQKVKSKLIEVGKQIKSMRYDNEYNPRPDPLNYFKCPRGESGCFSCTPFEKIMRGEAKYVGRSIYDADAYLI